MSGLPDCFPDDGDALVELIRGHHQRRGEADDVAVGGLGDEAVVLHGHAEIPGGAAVGRVVDDDGVEEAASAHLDDEVGFGDEVLHGGAEPVAEVAGLLGELFVPDHVEGGHGHRAADRVAAEGGAVLAGVDDAHDVVVGEDGADGVDAAGDGLSEDEQVGLDVFGLTLAVALARAGAAGGEQGSGPGDAGLDLIGHEQDVGRLAEGVGLLDVAFAGHIDTGLPLDGLDKEAGHIGVLQCLFQRADVVVGNDLEARGEGAESTGGVRVGGEADDGGRPAVEVVLAGQDLGLACGDALDVVCPLTRNLDGGLDGLGAGVHRQDLVVTEVLGYVFLIGTEHAVVEGAGGERELFGLLRHRPHDAGVTMTLVDSTVSAQEIVIPFALDVPAVDAVGSV